jgi:hypothetical protein
MTRRLVRLIGGVAAGQEFWNNGAPTVRVPKHPDFNVCRECQPETYDGSQMVEHYEEYEAHLIRFTEGYSHCYGYPAKGASAAHAMNELWHVYSKASRRNDGE